MRTKKDGPLNHITKCKRCNLYSTRRNVVIGRGAIPAKMLFLGEAPGLSEDLTGVPFSGPSGALLDRMIVDACQLGITELEMPTTYYTNIIMCHATDRFAGDNRAPTREEIFSCAANVMEVYHLVKPRLVVFVGKEAKHYYGSEFPGGVEIYHPSYLLRTGGVSSRYYMHTVRVLHDAIEDLWEELDNEERLSKKGTEHV